MRLVGLKPRISQVQALNCAYSIRVLLGFYWVLLGFIGFYWVLLGFIGFYWGYIGVILGLY